MNILNKRLGVRLVLAAHGIKLDLVVKLMRLYIIN